MAKGFKVKLKANRYRVGGREFHRPFETIISEDSEDLRLFQNNTAFELTPCEVSHQVNPPAVAPEEEPVDGLLLSEVEGLSKKYVDILNEAGYKTAEQLLSEDVEFEDLTKLKGLGDSSVNTILELCGEAVKTEPGDDDDDEENE